MADESPDPAPKSFGKMSAHHWSRARRDSNQEALEYYRERSHAPGVEAGGAARNFYCMECDGVIPHDSDVKACPHCAAPIEGSVKRYFNWVEMDERPRSELRALLPLVLVAIGVLVAALIVLVGWVL